MNEVSDVGCISHKFAHSVELGQLLHEKQTEVNNKSFAAMISLDEVNIQDIMPMASRLRAQTATLSIRNQAHKNGMNGTTVKKV